MAALLSPAPVPRTRPADDVTDAIGPLYPKLLRFALHLSGDATDAEDLVQDAAERALRAREQFHFGQSPERWLRTIVHNRFIDEKRRARKRPRVCEEAKLANLAERHATLEEDRSAREQVSFEEVEAAVAGLPAHLRTVLVLRLKGAPYGDLASVLGVTPLTIGTRLSRARRRLRAILARPSDGGRDRLRLSDGA